jgi:hypothetical protein
MEKQASQKQSYQPPLLHPGETLQEVTAGGSMIVSGDDR